MLTLQRNALWVFAAIVFLVALFGPDPDPQPCPFPDQAQDYYAIPSSAGAVRTDKNPNVEKSETAEAEQGSKDDRVSM